MLARSVHTLLPSPDPTKPDVDRRRYRESGQGWLVVGSREVPAQRKDGSMIDVALSVRQVGSQPLFTATLLDVTRQKQLEREVVHIAALEQQRIGQDLHDDVGQELTALGLLAESLEEAPSTEELVRKIHQGIRRTVRKVRGIAHGLARAEVRPAELYAALAELTAHLGETSVVRCTFHGDRAVLVQDDLQATQLYHIAQEACSNALKHAGAANLEVRLRSVDGALVLQVQDDGTGIPAGAAEGLGRRIMRNRASVIGARLSIGAARPRGTVVTCTLNQEQADGLA
jgi:signal transduction histidine kinase